jgi:hypothetical protein
LLRPAEEFWSPIGFMFIDDQLYKKPIKYQVDYEPTLERSEQWEIFNSHPFFTCICSNFGDHIGESLIHYDCGSCGWKDDSLE